MAERPHKAGTGSAAGTPGGTAAAVRHPLGRPRPREAWLDELERTADRCQVQCLQLAPLTEKKQKGKDGEWLEVTLEGNYVQLLTFFRQWEQAHPGSWTENGTLEADGSGRKIRYNGKFHVVIKKSSKSR